MPSRESPHPTAGNNSILIQQQHVVLREEFGDLCLVLRHDRVMREKNLGPLHPERWVRLALEIWPLTARDVVALAVQKIAEACHQLGSVASVRGLMPRVFRPRNRSTIRTPRSKAAMQVDPTWAMASGRQCCICRDNARSTRVSALIFPRHRADPAHRWVENQNRRRELNRDPGLG